MAAITIRNLDDVKTSLRVQAARHGRSMEDEARRILRDALIPQKQPIGGLGTRVHQRFARLGGVDLDLPARDEPALAATFEP